MELFTIGDKLVSISPEAIEAGKSAMIAIADVMLVVAVVTVAGLAIAFGVFWIAEKRRTNAYNKILLKNWKQGKQP